MLALDEQMDSSSAVPRYWISNNHSGLDERQWNALIGIVTAIVGNVLISFALNLQRYAHIRLNREKAAWELGAKSGHSAEYAAQAKIAEERSRANRKASETRGSFHQGGDANENTPLRGERWQSSTSIDTGPLGSIEDDEEEQDANKSYLRSPWWWAGITLMTIGEAGNFLAYGFAPASIVSPLGVVALISNCIIAPWLLKERFRQRDAWGVLIAIAGVVTLVLSAKNSEDRMGPDDIWSSITRWEFELYLGITATAMLLLVWASSRYGDRSILIDVGLVALFGGYTALSTKGVASLLSDQLWRTLTYPVTYLLVFILVATAVLQIRYLNRALSRFDSTQVIPTQFVMFTISVIVGSAVLYRDFESADAERVGKFIGGCALTFLGVYFITSGRGSNKGTADIGAVEPGERGINLLDDEQEDEGIVGRRASTNSPLPEGRHHPEPSWMHSRQGSTTAHAKPPDLERVDSARSQFSRPFTPSNDGADSPLVENPWAEPREDLQSRRLSSRNTTTSSLPADTSEPATPTGRRLNLTAERPRASHRRSIADIFPGPISSPLSSSLSGVVADARRKDTPQRSKRPRLGFPKSVSSRTQAQLGDDYLQQSPGSPTPAHEDAEPGPGSKRSRSLSIGGALGSLLHKSSKKTRDEEHGRGPEDGSNGEGG